MGVEPENEEVARRLPGAAGHAGDGAGRQRMIAAQKDGNAVPLASKAASLSERVQASIWGRW